MDINKTTEQVQTDSKTNIKEQSKELWIFQYDNEPDIDKKELENLIGINIFYLVYIYIYIFINFIYIYF